MNARPVLLRRTTSINAPPSSGSGASSASVGGSGSGAAGSEVVDPEDAIPIADEEPGDPLMSMSKHKKKNSELPAPAEVFNRASVASSLDLINDEEEGGIGGDSPYMNPDDASEYSDIFSNNSYEVGGGGGGVWSTMMMSSNTGARLSPSRIVAAVTVVLMVAGYLVMNPPAGSTYTTNNPLGNTNNSDNAAGGASDLASTPHHNPDTPNSKEITIGEFHEESVGAPLEHHVHEYNKIRFFDSPDKMKPMISKGPALFDTNMGGLHVFENVCLTNNADAIRNRSHPDTTLRGLIYFTNDKTMMNNPRRCVPCSVNYDAPFLTWGEEEEEASSQVNHQCGMSGLHAMYASSVDDWSKCILQDENTNLMEEFGQTQEPTDVSTVHFFQEPTFLLQFNALDKVHSLFDMLLSYLPHWEKFMIGDDADGDDAGFPFDSVISHSLKGCLSHSRDWFCEVLHQMYAFGEAKEIPWESDEHTLYCYKELFYNEVGYYQRNLDQVADGSGSASSLVTKEMFGNFREMLFRKFGLPRRRTVELRAEEAEFEKAHESGSGTKTTSGGDGDDEGDNSAAIGSNPKIIFYDNKLSEHAVWSEMESLISNVRELEKYQNVKFVTVNEDFSDLTVAQQARKFNEADAVIMAHGQQMANAIFAIDGTYFVEVGCKVDSLIGNPSFMELFDGKYRAVERCSDKNAAGKGDNICVVCNDEETDIFTMNPAAFERLIDDVVASLEI